MKLAPLFFALMFLLFLGLKLGHVIDWSWVWVTAPIWGYIALLCLVMSLMVVGVGLSEVRADRRRR